MLMSPNSPDQPLSALIIATRDYPASQVVSSLVRLGFRVSESRYGLGTFRTIAKANPQVVLFAMHPADETERHIIARVSELTDAAIIVLAPGTQQAGFVECLREGADGCLSEGHGYDWLAAQVEAIMRRTAPQAGSRSSTNDLLELGDLVVNFSRFQVRVMDQPLHLTPMEFRIFAALAENAGAVMSPSHILANVNEAPYTAQQARDAVKVYIRSIRLKLAAISPEVEYIVNMRGFGYMLEPSGKDKAARRIAQ
jgi:two-component system KDP operon response regulator KdpE